MNTGRYHPPIVELNSDGSGRMQNSNNFGGINPGSGLFVDVKFGVEYITDLAFAPANFTIGVVPEPSSFIFLGLGMGGLLMRRRREVKPV